MLAKRSRLWPSTSLSDGIRSVSTSRATVASRRARRAPRQKWMPLPKEMWLRALGRWMSNSPASSKTLGWWLAAARLMKMLVPAGTLTPATSASTLATRRQLVWGDSKRSTSSSAAGIRDGSAQS